jgi:hypothetical protein
MLVVDLMHEFEQGVWKALFIHLLRMLDSTKGGSLINELDLRYIVFHITSAVFELISQRFRNVPTFGKGTIRKFTSNASAMKRFAAHDFEDLLQVRSYIRSDIFFHLLGAHFCSYGATLTVRNTGIRWFIQRGG